MVISQANESKDIEAATTAIGYSAAQPDNKTRRYDRQLRLWAASGQSALESSRILLLSSSATSTQVLKNLVLPGIGHYTILDAGNVRRRDVGNNFFLEVDSVGKKRAAECVRLVGELNESVQGVAVVEDLDSILKNDPHFITTFTLVIGHNLPPAQITTISGLLSTPTSPTFIVVRSAGFLGEFFIQFHEHTIVDSHAETPPSLRIDKPFPALLEYAQNLDLKALDPTDHGHIPYVIILVKAMEEWKAAHDKTPPRTYAEKQEFKKLVRSMALKSDEENFEEAEQQAYRAWTPTTVPSDIQALFDHSAARLERVSKGEGEDKESGAGFYRLLWALREFTKESGGVLPLTSTLPDMKADTEGYIRLQKMYKERSGEEAGKFREILKRLSVEGEEIEEGAIDEFVRNAHGLRILTGEPWGTFDKDRAKLVESLSSLPRDAGVHLALSALDAIRARRGVELEDGAGVEVHELRREVIKLVGGDVELPDEVEDMIGEVARAPTADLPTTAAFLGGLVAQESIKMITKQYVPVRGYCTVDLVGSVTGVVGA